MGVTENEKYDTTSSKAMSPEDTATADYVAILLDTDRSHLDYRSWKTRLSDACVVSRLCYRCRHQIHESSVSAR